MLSSHTEMMAVKAMTPPPSNTITEAKNAVSTGVPCATATIQAPAVKPPTTATTRRRRRKPSAMMPTPTIRTMPKVPPAAVSTLSRSGPCSAMPIAADGEQRGDGGKRPQQPDGLRPPATRPVQRLRHGDEADRGMHGGHQQQQAAEPLGPPVRP